MKEAKVYLSEQAYREILLENERHEDTECMNCGLGTKGENEFEFCFDRMIDSGIEATYTPAFCEKDHEYVDHVMNIALQEYDIARENVIYTAIHRHMEGVSRFSHTDKKFNKQLAAKQGGAVAGLMWRTPHFHMKFWYIDEKGREYPASVYVDDEKVKRFMPKKDVKMLRKSLDIKANPRTCEDELEETRGYSVFLPKEYKESGYEGSLYGYYHPETLTFNVVPKVVYEKRTDTRQVGYIRKANTLDVYDVEEDDFICGVSYKDLDGNWQVDLRIGDRPNPVLVDFYSFQEEAFSRNEGVLEPEAMKAKKATIIGVGSLGSVVAEQLVKAGIGELNLVEGDYLSYTNLSRHVLGIPDIGRNKALAMADHLLEINPNCKVHAYATELEAVDPALFQEMLSGDSVVICCADNRHASYIVNELADEYKVPMVAAGCGSRASTTEIFYYKPDADMPCYECMFGPDRGVDLSGQAVSRRFYATERELEKLTFQPGMHLDISIAALIASKVSIDLLMEKEEGYELKILPYIKQLMLMVNFAIDEEINPLIQLFKNKETGRIKPFQWKNAGGVKNPECTHCGSDEIEN